MTSASGVAVSTPTNSRPNVWKKGWVIVFSSFFISFITEGLVFSFGIMLVEINDYFDKGRATAGAILSATTATEFLLAPVVGALVKKYGHRINVVIGALVSCTGFVMSSFVTSIFHLWITYGLLGGLGFGMMYVTANMCVLQHFDKHRALASGITASGAGIGIFVFNYTLRLFIDHYGWRGTCLLLAGFLLQCVIFGLLMSSTSKKSLEPEGNGTSCLSRVKSLLSSIFQRELLTDMRCIMFLLSVLIVGLAYITPFTFIPDQVKQKGMTKAEAAMLTSSIGIASTVGRVLFGWIGDRFCFSRLIILDVMMLLIGLLTGLSPLMSSFETKLVYTCLFGTLTGGYVTLFTVVLVEMVKPDLIPNAVGLIYLSIGAGFTAGAPVAGFLFDITGNYNITFIVCGAEFIVGAILLFTCKLIPAKN